MLNTILLILGGLALASLAFFAVLLIDAKTGKLHNEADLVREQANHVIQTAKAEALNAEANIRAFEQQGVNKFRTELARLGGNLRAIEQKIGSKLKGLTPEEHEEKLAISRKIITDQQDVIDNLQNLSPKAEAAVVYNGQPSPGAVIDAVSPGETHAAGSA